MSAEAVHMFLMRRGFRGSLSAQQAVCFLHESISMYAWLQERGLEMPEESITDAFRRTGVIAGSVSTDDGYASAMGKPGIQRCPVLPLGRRIADVHHQGRF